MALVPFGADDEIVDGEVVTNLDDDADWLRERLADVQRSTAEIAARLALIQRREGWTTRQLAAWCEEKAIGFGGQSRVVQLLAYDRTLGVLDDSCHQASEGMLRPLTKALTQGMPAEQAVAVWREIEAHGDRTAARVAEAVQSAPFVQAQAREKERQRKAKEKAEREAATKHYDDTSEADRIALCERAVRHVSSTFDQIVDIGCPWGGIPDADFDRMMTTFDGLWDLFRSHIEAAHNTYHDRIKENGY